MNVICGLGTNFSLLNPTSPTPFGHRTNNGKLFDCISDAKVVIASLNGPPASCDPIYRSAGCYYGMVDVTFTHEFNHEGLVRGAPE